MENMIISAELIKKLQDLIRDFGVATDDDNDPSYLSDGEWLDAFYAIACDIASSAKMDRR
jgi:hypothetical protein